MIGIVDSTFPFAVHAWNGCFTSVWTGQNGMEISVFMGATVVILYARILYHPVAYTRDKEMPTVVHKWSPNFEIWHLQRYLWINFYWPWVKNTIANVCDVYRVLALVTCIVLYTFLYHPPWGIATRMSETAHCPSNHIRYSLKYSTVRRLLDKRVQVARGGSCEYLHACACTC